MPYSKQDCWSFHITATVKAAINMLSYSKQDCWSFRITATVKAAINLLPYSKQDCWFFHITATVKAAIHMLPYSKQDCWSIHITATVKAAINLLPYSKREYLKGIQWKNITPSKLKFRKLSFWVLVPLDTLWPLLSQKQWARSTLVDKCWQQIS